MTECRAQKYLEQEDLCWKLRAEYLEGCENSGGSFSYMFKVNGIPGILHQLEHDWDLVEKDLLSYRPEGKYLISLASTALKALVELKSNDHDSCEFKAILHSSLCKDLARLYPIKNENYDDSFGKTVQKYGPISALTRLSDKWNRIEALLKGGKDKVGETVEDTLMDLADYSLITVVELKRYNSKLDEQRPFEAITK